VCPVADASTAAVHDAPSRPVSARAASRPDVSPEALQGVTGLLSEPMEQDPPGKSGSFLASKEIHRI
jgi:hypothetical protein